MVEAKTVLKKVASGWLLVASLNEDGGECRA
jgi:hypothetical protein